MSYRFEKGTGRYLGVGDAPLNESEVIYGGPFEPDEDNIDLGIVWDEGLQAMRLRDGTEKLDRAKQHKRRDLRAEAVRQAAQIYDFINSPDYYFFAEDLYLATVAAARAPLSGRLLQFKVVKDTFDAKRAEINALADINLVRAYDVTAGW